MANVSFQCEFIKKIHTINHTTLQTKNQKLKNQTNVESFYCLSSIKIQSSTMRIPHKEINQTIYISIRKIIPLVSPTSGFEKEYQSDETDPLIYGFIVVNFIEEKLLIKFELMDFWLFIVKGQSEEV